MPKKDGKWRLIHHLSFPNGESVNDFIDKDLCSVKYTSFDTVVDSVSLIGKNCLLGKVDIKNAFRLLPVHIDDVPLLGLQLNGLYFVDKALIMCTLGEICYLLGMACLLS